MLLGAPSAMSSRSPEAHLLRRIDKHEMIAIFDPTGLHQQGGIEYDGGNLCPTVRCQGRFDPRDDAGMGYCFQRPTLDDPLGWRGKHDFRQPLPVELASGGEKRRPPTPADLATHLLTFKFLMTESIRIDPSSAESFEHLRHVRLPATDASQNSDDFHGRFA